MSWSFSCIGPPENVAKALEEHAQTLNGASKDEFDAALPHLLALVRQNFTKPGTIHLQPLIEFDAGGSGSGDVNADGSRDARQRSCKVTILPTWKRVV